jgi:hypothetical protein
MLFRLWFYACKLGFAGFALFWLGSGFALFSPWGAGVAALGGGVVACVLAMGAALALPFSALGRPMACPFCGSPSEVVLFARRMKLECPRCGTVHGDPFRDAAVAAPANPTRDWQRPAELALEFDFDRATLNGVGLGQPLSRLSWLGPAEDMPALVTRNFGYLSLGLSAGMEGPTDAITGYFLYFSGSGDVPYRPFAGRVVRSGQELALSARTMEPAVVGQLGPPYWRDADPDGILLFYETPGREIQLEFSRDGRLRLLFAPDRPLLADDQQRRAFGVTADWPPAGAGESDAGQGA